MYTHKYIYIYIGIYVYGFVKSINMYTKYTFNRICELCVYIYTHTHEQRTYFGLCGAELLNPTKPDGAAICRADPAGAAQR